MGGGKEKQEGQITRLSGDSCIYEGTERTNIFSENTLFPRGQLEGMREVEDNDVLPACVFGREAY